MVFSQQQRGLRQRSAQCRHRYPGKDQPAAVACLLPPSAQQHHRAPAQPASAGGQQGNAVTGHPGGIKGAGQHHRQRCPGINAEQGRGGQRVTRQRLQQAAGQRQAGPEQHRHQAARQAQIQHQRLRQ